jgi:hypothetical protein
VTAAADYSNGGEIAVRRPSRCRDAHAPGRSSRSRCARPRPLAQRGARAGGPRRARAGADVVGARPRRRTAAARAAAARGARRHRTSAGAPCTGPIPMGQVSCPLDAEPSPAAWASPATSSRSSGSRSASAPPLKAIRGPATFTSAACTRSAGPARGAQTGARVRRALTALGLAVEALLLADVRELLVDPVARIALGDDPLQPLAPPGTLGGLHRQRGMDRVGELLDVERVDR